MEPCAEVLAQALTMLQQATALEMAGATAEAVAMYGAAVSRCEAAAPCLPGALADTVRRNVDEMRRAMDVLRRVRDACEDDKEDNDRIPRFRITFTAQPMPVEDYRAPVTAVARVFWLMRLLARSMQRGAFLTPRLYVGKDVWCQDGAVTAVRHVAAKTRYCVDLCTALEQLRSMTTFADVTNTLKRLQTFATAEAQLRAILERDLGRHVDTAATASRSGLWNMLTRKAVAWRQRECSMEMYVTWACNALEQSQLLEQWLTYATLAATQARCSTCDTTTQQTTAKRAATTATTAEEVVSLLQHLAGSYYDGICSFLLHDAAVLTQRYEYKCCTSVVELLPAHVQLDGDNKSIAT